MSKPIVARYFLSICLAISTGSWAHAENQSRAEDLKKNDLAVAKAISKPVDDLLEAGIDRIGEVDLNVVRKRISEVHFEIEYAAKMTQGRVGHRYNVETKTVIFSSEIFESNNQIETVAALLHEFLGAAGFIDEKSEITSSILAQWMLLKDPTSNSELKYRARSLSNELKLNGTIRHENPTTIWQKRDSSGLYFGPQGLTSGALRKGGVTEGGGGGDPASIALKAVLLFAMTKEGASTLEANLIVNRINIETYVFSEGFLEVRCPLNRKGFNMLVKKKKSQAALTYYIPSVCTGNAIVFNELKAEVKKLVRSHGD